MPTKPIPFAPLNKSIGKPAQSTFNQAQYDGYWQEYMSPDGMKYVWAKRPGKTLFCDLSEAAKVDGLYYWVRQNVTIAVCNGKVFSINSSGTATDITGTATMTAGNRPTFADVAGSSLYVASGGQIGAYPAAAGAYLTDGDAPTAVRFVATINKTLVALRDDDERFDWADAAAPTTWAGEYSNAEAEPDLVKSMIVANNYLYFHGQNTIEAWRDDGTTFVRETQGAIQRGTLARYSVCNINGQIYCLDDTREVSRLNGFSVEVISNPALSRYMKSFTTVADAQGDYVKIEGRHFYVLSFPTELKTLVYDIGLNQWMEWSYWDDNASEHTAWVGNCTTDAFAWNKFLVGDRSSSKIYTFSGTTDNSDTIRTVLQTDFIDRGDPRINKFCHELNLVFKRVDTASTPKTFLINWRDDGETSWSDSREQEVEVEATNATEMTVDLRRLGHYKRRQWRIIITDATLSALVSIQERFDYGR